MNQRDFNELQNEVEALRRRVDEQGALIRKTHHATTSLAESVASIVQGQRRRERGVNLNSFVAYLLFTLLLGGGFFALYNARAGDLARAYDEAAQERDQARARISSLETEIERRGEAERRAHDYFQLLRDGKRSEAIARYPEIEEEALSPTERAVFEDGVGRARAEIVDAGYLAGLDAYRTGDNDTATVELRRALAYEDEGPRAAQMRYYLGMAHHKKGEHEDAARQLELAIAGRVDQSGVSDARYYLAATLEALGKYGDARTEYDKFASAHPQSPLAFSARRKAAQLSRKASPVN